MFRIVKKAVLAEKIKEIIVEAPFIAAKARPGNFVLVRGDEHGERIPLTIADSDAAAGTVTLVMQEIGKSTQKLGTFEEGESYLDVVGPLGHDREIPTGKTICCVSGGLGVAPMYPQTKACFDAGNRVISIIGARSKSLFFWQDRMEAKSEKVYYATDDGSFGHHGFATQILEKLIQEGEKFDEVIAIGPVPHMKAVANCCKKYNVPVIVSLNPVMVDGTGMCGGCRVTVAGKTKYACVDGPEFDGADIDFDELMARQGSYKHLEREAVEGKTNDNGHVCNLDRQVEEWLAKQRKTEHVHRTQEFEEEAVAMVLSSLSRIVSGTARFDEVAPGLTALEAELEAFRCRICSDPQCVAGCPVEVEIPQFIRAIQEGDMPRAAAILKGKNSLPAICGRVCPQETQCEIKCILGKYERPVSIGALERFVADWEAKHGLAAPEVAPPNGHRVAVIGCGPGGLTCAGDLAKQGYAVTIFEAFHDTGGVLRYGIPEFRLPKTIVDREVEYVKSLGVEIKLNMVVGKVFTVEDLVAQGYEAVFIAVGAGAPAFMRIPGENLVGVFSANEFLTRVNLMKAYKNDFDTPVLVGKKIAVIGAGNVAMDAARTSLRLGAETVTIVYRRSEAEMPARLAEIHHAKEEGVVLQLLTNPKRILGDDKDRVIGLECLRMELGEPDDSGRRRPVPVEGSEFVIECDMVIPALGNNANPLLTSNTKGLALNKWGNIVADDATCATSIPGVYAGGDIVIGAATVIEAMGAGKRAARAIDQYLREKNAAAVR